MEDDLAGGQGCLEGSTHLMGVRVGTSVFRRIDMESIPGVDPAPP